MSENSGPQASSSNQSTTPDSANDGLQSPSATSGGLGKAAADTVRKAASEGLTDVTGQVKDILNRQVNNGAEMVGHVAQSAQRAAEDLEESSPQVANLVQSLAAKLEGYSDGLRDKSVDDLARSAADFTRRQPALVFGLAMLAGFLAFRTLKVAQATPSAES